MEKTIEKTIWTNRPALKKMIEETAGNIGKPRKIEKADGCQKTFSYLWSKFKKNLTARN